MKKLTPLKELTTLPITIADFQTHLNELYGDVNKDRSIEYLYSYLNRNASYLCRRILENRDSKRNFIKVISWLFALASKTEIDLENAFVNKYPNICPYCLVRPCVCVLTGKKPVSYIPEYRADIEIRAQQVIFKRTSPTLSIDDAFKNINELYPANKHIWNAAGPLYQFYRLLEELGEIHEAYSMYMKGKKTKENIGEEMADAFAWILSSWGIVFPDLSLRDELIGYYWENCPVCKNCPCECNEYSDRPERLITQEQLDEFKSKLEKLVELVPEQKEKLEEIVNSLEFASKNTSDTSAIRNVKQSTTYLEDLADNLNTTDKLTKSISSIIQSILDLAEKFPWS